jgi:hypothetical protein
MRKTSDPNERVVMPSEEEYFLFDVGVPDKCFVVETGADKALVHRAPVTPVQTVHPLLVPPELFLRRVGADVPEANIAIESCGNKCTLRVDGEDIANRRCMSVLLGILFEEGVPT